MLSMTLLLAATLLAGTKSQMSLAFRAALRLRTQKSCQSTIPTKPIARICGHIVERVVGGKFFLPRLRLVRPVITCLSVRSTHV